MLLKLAWRNLWRNRRRSLLTILALFLSLFFLIITLEIYDAMMLQSVRENLDRFEGHARISRSGFFREFRLNLTIPEDSFPEEVRRDKEVLGYAPRLIAYALISSGVETYGTRIVGIDTLMESRTTKLRESLVKGWFLRGKGNPILLSRPMSTLLGVDVGDTVFIVGTGWDGSLYAENLVVSGIFETGSPSVDASTNIMRLNDLQKLLSLEGRVHYFAIRLKNPMNALKWKRKFHLKEMEIKVWQEWMKGIWEIMRVWNGAKILFGILFYMAVVLIAFNTFMMAFYERRREFAVILALGMKRRKLFLAISMEGILMGVIAVSTALPFSIAVSYLLNRFPVDVSGIITAVSWAGIHIKPEISAAMNPFNFISSSLLLLLLIFIASLVVSVRVFHIDVSRIIRERMI